MATRRFRYCYGANLGDGGGLLSYALRNSIVAFGKAAVTVPGSGSATSLSISYAGITKNDTALITFNQNGAVIQTNQVPWIYEIIGGTGMNITFNLDNTDPEDKTVYIEWAVLR